MLDNNAYDADALEVRRDEWIDVWDDVLNMGVFIVGDWSSDSHRGITNGKLATYLYAEDRTFDSLISLLSLEGFFQKMQKREHGLRGLKRMYGV